MTALAAEKAAPIPADVHASMLWTIQRFRTSMQATELLHTMLTNPVVQKWLADREARPSLPDSREDHIRAEAAKDERDRLYAEACRPAPNNEENETVAALACAAATWLRLTQGVQPTARARQGGNNG